MAEIQRIPTELVSNTLYFDYKTPITRVIPALKKYPAVIINKGGDYLGIVDSRAIYRTTQGFKLGKEQSVEKFTVRVPKITDSTSVDDLIYYFYRARVKALPYVEGGRIRGIFERKTLLKMLLSLKILEDIKVNEAMSTPVLAVDYNTSVAQARAAMWENNVNKLVVLQEGIFAGLISNYDITHQFAKTEQRLPKMSTVKYSPANMPISGMMERNPVTIEQNRSLSEGVRALIERNISSLIVLKNANPVGILSVLDVLESVIARRRIEQKRLFLSGFDENTHEYEDEAREELMSFLDRIEKMRYIKVDYMTLRVKRVKLKSYELQARLSLGRQGVISLNTSKHSFTEGFRDLMQKLEKHAKKEKELALTIRKVNTSREEL